MAIGLCRQIERRLTHEVVTNGGEIPWRRNRRSYHWDKTGKHRRERRLARLDPECEASYRRYCGYEL
jgi:hypothetical protein